MTDSKKGSNNPFRAIFAVLSAFGGIRRSKDSRNDVANLKPLQIIVAALICAGLLILGLLTLVHSITK